MKRESVPGGATALGDTVVPPDAERVPVAPAVPVAIPVAPVSKPEPPPAGKAGPSYLRQHRWQALAALVVPIGAGALGFLWWLGPQVSSEAVVRRDFGQTVVASGHLEAPHRLNVGVQITGTLLRIPVIEGQAVMAGELLVALEATELNATGRQADVAVLQAQARLRQLQEVQGPVAAQTLRKAESGLTNARAALARSQTLFGQGFISPAALDDARQTTAMADAELLGGLAESGVVLVGSAPVEAGPRVRALSVATSAAASATAATPR